MKKIFLLVLVLVCLFSVAMAEETDLEFVSKMDYVLELPDVIRKGTYSGETMNGIPNGFGVFETTNSSGIIGTISVNGKMGKCLARVANIGMMEEWKREFLQKTGCYAVLCVSLMTNTCGLTTNQMNTVIMKRKNIGRTEVSAVNAVSTRIADCTIKEQFTPKTGKCFSPANLEKDSIGI